MPPLRLRNPHSVAAVLETRPQDIYELNCLDRDLSEGWRDVRASAEALGIRVGSGDAGRSKSRGKGKQRRHAGAEAVVRPRDPEDLDALVDVPSGNGIWIGLDTVQDPHNVGSIFRTAAFFGVSGLITTQDRNAPISHTVYDVASGGVEYVPFAVETNLSRTIERCRDAGIWILGTSEHADKPLSDIGRDRPWLVIVGNEEGGLRRLTVDKCDDLVSIPRRGSVGSLNVSVAAGITLAHLASA